MQASLGQASHRISAIRALAEQLSDCVDADQSFRALAGTLSSSFADACAVQLTGAAITAPRLDDRDQMLAGIATVAVLGVHAFGSPRQAQGALPPEFGPYIERFGLRALAILPLGRGPLLRGTVLVARGRGCAFDIDDLGAMEACITCTTLVAEGALHLAAERSRARAEHERVVAFQQTMLGVVAHDLRGPLGAMIIGSERLTTESSVSRDAIARIVSFANRMSRTVEQLVEMTRAQLAGDRHESC